MHKYIHIHTLITACREEEESEDESDRVRDILADLTSSSSERVEDDDDKEHASGESHKAVTLSIKQLLW
jgi:hypothetical protein